MGLMKRIALILIGLFITSKTIGQIVKLQVGTSISNLDWKIGDRDNPFFDQSLVGYSIFFGLDYKDKKYYNLSSNIGFLTKGGMEDDYIGPDPEDPNFISDRIDKAKLNYLSINTVVDFKYPIKKVLTPFISVGPRFDYLVSHNETIDWLDEELNNYNFGLLLGGGLKYDFSKIQIGLRSDYYLNFNNIAEWKANSNGAPGSKINDKTFTINLTLGYKLK